MGSRPTHPIHLEASYASGLGRRTTHHPPVSMTAKHLYQQVFGLMFIHSHCFMMFYPSNVAMVSSDTITIAHSHCKSAHSSLTMDESRFGSFYYAWLHWVYPIVIPSSLCFPLWNSHMRLHPLSLQSQSLLAFRPPLLIYYLGLTPSAFMPQGGHRQRGRSHKGGVIEWHTDSIIALVVEAYEAHTPPHIWVELDLAEADARVLRCFFNHAAVSKEIGQWISNLVSCREHNTLYTKTVNLY